MKQLAFLWVRIRRRRARVGTFADVIRHSRVNGAVYGGESLPQVRWNWPTNTWLRRRLSAFSKENH
jgi:hypothetical protein